MLGKLVFLHLSACTGALRGILLFSDWIDPDREMVPNSMFHEVLVYVVFGVRVDSVYTLTPSGHSKHCNFNGG